ncbi:unnamed protein product [Rotaria magnacalcarata]
MEPLDNNDDIDKPDESDEINMDVTCDESDNDESSETYDSNEEESLLNNSDEEFEDDWTTNVVQSDSDIAYEQNMIIIANIKRNLCYDVKSRWNSTFSMIDSLLVLRQLIQKLFNYKHQLTIQSKQVKKLADYELTSDDWNVFTTTTNSPNKTNSTGNLNKSAIDIFNESIGDIHYEESRRGENTRATIVNEFQNYRKYATQFNLKHKPDATSAIIFWRTYGDTFSILRGLAKKMLSTPATSVPSESCFSLSSSLGRKERVCLTGDNLSSSVFLKDKINF